MPLYFSLLALNLVLHLHVFILCNYCKSLNLFMAKTWWNSILMIKNTIIFVFFFQTQSKPLFYLNFVYNIFASYRIVKIAWQTKGKFTNFPTIICNTVNIVQKISLCYFHTECLDLFYNLNYVSYFKTYFEIIDNFLLLHCCGTHR